MTRTEAILEAVRGKLHERQAALDANASLCAVVFDLRFSRGRVEPRVLYFRCEDEDAGVRHLTTAARVAPLG